MSSTLLDSTYTDENNFPILWSDNVLSCFFYDTSSESWDRTGGGTASWYLERDFPNDTFYSRIFPDRWNVLGSSSLKTITVNDKATFQIDNEEGSLYLSSEGLWSLTGDFEIRLGIINDDHYDEYRGATGFGFNVNFGSNYNVRAAKVRNYEETTTKYQGLKTENANPLYFGWFPIAAAKNQDGDERDYLLIRRVGSTVSTYAGSTYLGGVSGSDWTGDASISIGAESAEINTYNMSAAFFSIVSGELSTPTFFDSDFRGPNRTFPEKSLLVMDDYGLSIVEYPDYNLWARFRVGDTKALRTSGSKVIALNGRIYCVNSYGYYIFDFVADRFYKYAGVEQKVSDVGVSLRNSFVQYPTTTSGVALMSDNVVDVSAKNIDGKEFVAIATTSGINVIIDRTITKQNSEGNSPATAIYFSDNDSLYWANFNVNNQGDLSYYNNVGLLTTVTGTTFSRHGYYDSDTSPYNLSSEHIYSIHTVNYNGVDQIALGTEAGINVLVSLPAEVKSYGIEVADNPLQDPSFESPIGVYWKYTSNTFHPMGTIDKSTDWSTDGSTSLRLAPGSLEGDVSEGSYYGVYQRVNLDNVGRIYFDIGFLPGSGFYAQDDVFYQVVIDSTVVSSKTEYELDNGDIIAEAIDTTNYNGYHDFIVRMYANDANPLSLTRYIYFDNFRLDYYPSQVAAIGGNSPVVSEVYMTYTDSVKKVVYATQQGYGSVDITDNTSDFFITVSDIQLGALVNSAEFIDYDSV